MGIPYNSFARSGRPLFRRCRPATGTARTDLRLVLVLLDRLKRPLGLQLIGLKSTSSAGDEIDANNPKLTLVNSEAFRGQVLKRSGCWALSLIDTVISA